LLPWLLPKVPADGAITTLPEAELSRTAGNYISNCLSLISRWKILDNLRRSLVSPVLVLLLLASWLWLPGSPFVWTLLALATLGTPAFIQLLETLIVGARSLTPPAEWTPLRNDLARWFLAVVFLPYEALITLNAIVVTLLRLLVTGGCCADYLGPVSQPAGKGQRR
jgi:cyclic beta-1,2-glucan synthetase